MSKKFLRSDTVRHLKLGKKRTKLQKWRRPRGRHNKIRKGRAGYPSFPTIGHKQSAKTSGFIKGLRPVNIENMKDLAKVKADSIAIISSRLGAFKRMSIIKKAAEMKIKILNVRENK